MILAGRGNGNMIFVGRGGGAIIRMKICQIGISKFWYVVQSTFKYVACVCSNAGILFCGRGRGEG